jgi:hypothetical protein
MNLKYLFIFFFVIQGCTKNELNDVKLDVVPLSKSSNTASLFFYGKNNKIEITNYSDSNLRITNFQINNASYLSNFNILFNEINKIADPKQLGFPYKTFRYLINNSYHFNPITSNTFLEHPLFFLNTIGSGYCDDVAAVFSIIMNKRGFPCQVYFLDGHVVPEVTYNDKKMIFDVDLRCFYVNKKQQIASYDDLVNDGELITNPIIRLGYADTTAYSEYVREIYTSTANNFINTAANRYDTSFKTFITLPKGSIRFFGELDNLLPALYNSFVPKITTASMRIESGYEGYLNLPLIITEINGDGIIEIQGNKMTVVEANNYIKNNLSNLINYQLNIINSRGINILMSLNPRRFFFNDGLNKFSIKLESVINASLSIK